jgi:hypothetical protein
MSPATGVSDLALRLSSKLLCHSFKLICCCFKLLHCHLKLFHHHLSLFSGLSKSSDHLFREAIFGLPVDQLIA